jgi:hypothetical protein
MERNHSAGSELANFSRFGIGIVHDISIFAGIVEVFTDDFKGFETDRSEEKLGWQVGLSDMQRDFGTTLA